MLRNSPIYYEKPRDLTSIPNVQREREGSGSGLKIPTNGPPKETKRADSNDVLKAKSLPNDFICPQRTTNMSNFHYDDPVPHRLAGRVKILHGEAINYEELATAERRSNFTPTDDFQSIRKPNVLKSMPIKIAVAERRINYELSSPLYRNPNQERDSLENDESIFRFSPDASNDTSAMSLPPYDNFTLGKIHDGITSIKYAEDFTYLENN